MARYDVVAPIYDGLGTLYSAGGIERAKLAHLKWLGSGERVLFPGAGRGADAIAAARRGADVTLVDTSPSMLGRARLAFERAGEAAHFHQCSIESFSSDVPFDLVVASFFLNVFARSEVSLVVRKLVDLLKPEGRLVIADFRGPRPNAAFRALQKAYYLPPLALFATVTGTPWHELYDYRSIVGQRRLPLEWFDEVVVSAFGLPLYEAICFRKVGE